MTFSVGDGGAARDQQHARGLLVVGRQPLIGLVGPARCDPSRAIALIVESFALALVPTLAFTCLAILFSVTTRNSMAGVLGAPVVGLVMVLLSLMGSGVVVRSSCSTSPFEAWHGLQVSPSTPKAALDRAAGAAWPTGRCPWIAAWRSFRRRDFAGDGQARVPVVDDPAAP